MPNPNDKPERSAVRRASQWVAYAVLAVAVSLIVYKGVDLLNSPKPSWSTADIRERIGKLVDDGRRPAKRQLVAAPVARREPEEPPVDVRSHAVKVEPLLFRSEGGVQRPCVERLAEAVRESLPRAKAIFGDPFEGGVKLPPYPVILSCQSNRFDSGSYRIMPAESRIRTSRRGDFAVSGLPNRICAAALCFSPEPNWEALAEYAWLVSSEGGAAQVAEVISLGREFDPGMGRYDWCGRPEHTDVPRVTDGTYCRPIRFWRTFAALEELRKGHPDLMRDYFALKLRKGRQGLLYGRMTVEQEMALFTEVVGSEAEGAFARYRWLPKRER